MTMDILEQLEALNQISFAPMSPVAPTKPASGLTAPWVAASYEALATMPEPPQWSRLGWPDEATWTQAGSPQVSYAQYQAQQASAFTRGLNAGMLQQAQQTVSQPLGGGRFASEFPLMPGSLPEMQAAERAQTMTGLEQVQVGLLGEPTVEELQAQAQRGLAGLGGLLEPVSRGIGDAVSGAATAAVQQPLVGGVSLADAYEGVGQGLDFANRALDVYRRSQPSGLTTGPGFAAAADVIAPKEPWELALEATPLGVVGDIQDIRRLGTGAFTSARQAIEPGSPLRRVLADETGALRLPFGNEPAPSIWHEGDANDVFDLLGSRIGRAGGKTTGLWVSDVPDLALGQGTRRGILVELDPSGVNLERSMSKPAAGVMGGSEFQIGVGGAAPKVRAVTIKPDAQMTRPARDRLLAFFKREGWERVKNADGSTTWRDPGAIRRFLADETGSVRLPGGGEPEELPDVLAQAARTPDEAIPPARTAAPEGAEAALQPGAVPEAGGVAVADVPPPRGPEPPAGGGEAPGEFAANIRLEKYPEDVREPIRLWAEANPDAVQAARRGTRSDEQVLAAAEQLVNDLGGKFDKIQRRWKPGQAWNAEEITAIRGALNDATQRVLSAAEAAQAAPGSIAEANALVEAILEHQRIQGIVHGVTAEAGRALRAFRQNAAEALASGDVRKMQEILRRALGKDATPAKIAEFAKKLRAIDINNPVAVNNFIRSVNKPNFWDKLHFYWINSILSGPVTQGRNIAGNIGASLYRPVQLLGAAGVETIAAPLTGRARERFWQEAPASLMGIFQGLPEGVHGALVTLRTGISPRAAEKLDLRPSPIGGIGGRILGAPTTLLGAMDEFFSAINTRAALNAGAVRMARREGLKGDALINRIADLKANPPPNLVKQATEEAEELVFRGDPGEVARAMLFLREKLPGGRYILPFLTTPANLLKYGIKNSPLGLLDIPAWKRAIAGNPQGADELANAFLGANIAAALGALVATGQIDITVAAPINAAERDRFFREGKQPFSVQIPGIGWVEYKQLPMLDTTFTLVGSVVDAIRRDEDPAGAVAQAVTNIGTNLLDKSYMSGIGDLFDAIQDPARYAERFVTRHLSGYVPFSGLLRQTAQTLDPTVRRPEGFEETIRTQIPGLSQTVPARLTAFGEEARRPFPSPIRVSPDRQMRVDRALESAGVEVQFAGRSVAGRALNRDQQHAYQRAAGRAVYDRLYNVISAPLFQALSPSQQAEALETAIQKGRAEVSREIGRLVDNERFKALPQDTQNMLLTQKLQELGDRESRGDEVNAPPPPGAVNEPVGETVQEKLEQLRARGRGLPATFTEQFRQRAEGEVLNQRNADSFRRAFGAERNPPGAASLEPQRPQVDPTVRLFAAKDMARKAGLPESLLTLAGYEERTTGASDFFVPGPAQGTIFLGEGNLEPGGQIPRGDAYVPIHEAIHALEFSLTADERAEAERLIAENPPVGGVPSTHHPAGQPAPAPTGITAYFDFLYGPWVAEGRVGERPPKVPTEIRQFINRVLKRLEAEPVGSTL